MRPKPLTRVLPLEPGYCLNIVMRGLDPRIHDLTLVIEKRRHDDRVKPAHDGGGMEGQSLQLGRHSRDGGNLEPRASLFERTHGFPLSRE
ncbi:MAG: hypothetical protein COB46_05690 [Rhodospirillaceae bacterium]|nr:MAG: hypothetical protein COB46_05690 [Rhodospirillaceae bacterium]